MGRKAHANVCWVTLLYLTDDVCWYVPNMRTISATNIVREIPKWNYSYLFSKYNNEESTVLFPSITLPCIGGKLIWGVKRTSRLTKLKYTRIYILTNYWLTGVARG
jgi:hypothetical protein